MSKVLGAVAHLPPPTTNRSLLHPHFIPWPHCLLMYVSQAARHHKHCLSLIFFSCDFLSYFTQETRFLFHLNFMSPSVLPQLPDKQGDRLEVLLLFNLPPCPRPTNPLGILLPPGPQAFQQVPPHSGQGTACWAGHVPADLIAAKDTSQESLGNASQEGLAHQRCLVRDQR